MFAGLASWPGGRRGREVAVPDGWHAGVELAGVAEELFRPLVVACRRARLGRRGSAAGRRSAPGAAATARHGRGPGRRPGRSSCRAWSRSPARYASLAATAARLACIGAVAGDAAGSFRAGCALAVVRRLRPGSRGPGSRMAAGVAGLLLRRPGSASHPRCARRSRASSISRTRSRAAASSAACGKGWPMLLRAWVDLAAGVVDVGERPGLACLQLGKTVFQPGDQADRISAAQAGGGQVDRGAGCAFKVDGDFGGAEGPVHLGVDGEPAELADADGPAQLPGQPGTLPVPGCA